MDEWEEVVSIAVVVVSAWVTVDEEYAVDMVDSPVIGVTGDDNVLDEYGSFVEVTGPEQ